MIAHMLTKEQVRIWIATQKNGVNRMKTVVFNGSPNKEGNTWHALKMVTTELEKDVIETEIECRSATRRSEAVPPAARA